MYEVVSLAAGVVLGVALLSIASHRTRLAVGAGASIAVGFAVAIASGEISESPLFVLWDAAQCAVAATLVVLAVERRRRHSRA